VSAQGRELELAIGRAAARYLREGRAHLRRQFLPTVIGAGGYIRPAGDAPIDFLGCTGPNEPQYVAGRQLAVECKETSIDRLPVGELHESQRSALAVVHGLGAIVLVVCDFTARGEVYAVTWQRVAEFYAKPWRKSLSLEWFRAMGLLLPETGRGEKGELRRTLFLDGKEHWARAHAQEAIEAERLANGTISLEVPDDESPPAPVRSEYAGLTKEQIQQRVRAAAMEGSGNALARSGRRGKWRKGGSR